MNTRLILVVVLTALVVGGGIVAIAGDRNSPRASVSRELKSLDEAAHWINSTPLTAAGLKGKVVLVSFWAFSCVNWVRTQPYLRAWAEKYKDQGLVVIGVHAPEFGFEKDLDKVTLAAGDLGVDYPVVIDNEFVIWRAFRNQYWPALYFIDAQGRMRQQKFGEGGYEESERVIQQLLSENGQAVSDDVVSVEPKGVEVAADWDSLGSPETYVGASRTENFVSPERPVVDEAQVYTSPDQLVVNQWALSGNWTFGLEAIAVNRAGGTISYRFHARDVNIVMGPTQDGNHVRFRVLIDGHPPGAAHGSDVDENGDGMVTNHRLYQLVRQSGLVVERLIEIEFPDAGAEAFSFTFG